MKGLGMLNLSALVASITIMAVAGVLFPEQLTGNVAIATLVIFALSVGFMFYVPSLLLQDRRGSDAAQMASIGLAGAISAFLLVATTIAFALALLGHDRLAVAMDVIAIGGLIVGGLTARSALAVIDEGSRASAPVSRHSLWQQEMQALSAGVGDDGARKEIDRLAEKLRYSANDVPGGSPQDAEIDSLLENLRGILDGNDPSGLSASVRKMEALLSRREIFIRSARSKV